MTTAQASIGQIGEQTEMVFLAYHGLCKAARAYVHRGWGTVGQKNAAGADDSSTGGRVSKASRQAWGWRRRGKGAGGAVFPLARDRRRLGHRR